MTNTQKLIDAFQKVINDIEKCPGRYNWRQMGNCNAGLVVRALTARSDDFIYDMVTAAKDFGLNKISWSTTSGATCPSTNEPLIEIFRELKALGLDHQQIKELEYLSNLDVLNRAGIVWRPRYYLRRWLPFTRRFIRGHFELVSNLRKYLQASIWIMEERASIEELENMDPKLGFYGFTPLEWWCKMTFEQRHTIRIANRQQHKEEHLKRKAELREERKAEREERRESREHRLNNILRSFDEQFGEDSLTNRMRDLANRDYGDVEINDDTRGTLVNIHIDETQEDEEEIIRKIKNLKTSIDYHRVKENYEKCAEKQAQLDELESKLAVFYLLKQTKK